MPYRVEVSPNARAGCKGPKPCKGTKIPKGEIRFATRVVFNEKDSWAYRHFGCMTPKIFENLSKELEGKLEDLDGFDELSEELQSKFRSAFENGQVDEADIPESARKDKDAVEEDGDEEPKPKKKAAPKRKKAADDEDDEAEEKPKKKAAPRKKAAKKAPASDEDDEADEVMPTKKSRGGAKGGRAAKKSAEEVGSDDE